jgi:hypothetical protein
MFTTLNYQALVGDALRECLVPNRILPSQNVASHKSVAAIKNVAKKCEAKF